MLELTEFLGASDLHEGRISKRFILLSTVFGILQIVLIPFFIGIDVPFRDEWDSIIRALVMKQTNGFHWNLLLLPVVEHRLPLPMSLFLLLSQPRYYSIFFMAICSILHFIGWLVFAKSWLTHPRKHGSTILTSMLFALVLALFFHYAQIINETMGVQLFWVLGPVATIFFIWGLLKEKFGITATSHIVSIMSFPSWPIHGGILGLFLLYHMQNKTNLFQNRFFIKTLIVIGITAILTFGFLYQHVESTFQLDPIRFLQFIFLVIGSPLSRNNQAMGYIFGASFVIIWLWQYLKRPWIVDPKAHFLYGTLTIIAGILIALGRHHYDYNYAFSGHYLLFTAPGWCIVLFEFFGTIKRQRLAVVGTSVALLSVTIMSGKELRNEIVKRRPILLQARECILLQSEHSAECQRPMEYIFLNGFKEKFELLEKSRHLGIYP